MKEAIKRVKDAIVDVSKELNRQEGMLVIDRKNGEGFWIDNRIFVKVLSVGTRRVKIGIVAPDGLSVVREELLERNKQKSEKTQKRSRSS